MRSLSTALFLTLVAFTTAQCARHTEARVQIISLDTSDQLADGSTPASGCVFIVEGEPLPDGSIVTVLARDVDESFELDAASEAELLVSLAEADRGELIPASSRGSGLLSSQAAVGGTRSVAPGFQPGHTRLSAGSGVWTLSAAARGAGIRTFSVAVGGAEIDSTRLQPGGRYVP